MIDSFTGYAVDNVGFPSEICFHISRPGESATIALRELKHRYPPIHKTRTGTALFYGGSERWEARIDGVSVVMGVLWPLKTLPDEGTCYLYVAKPRTTRTGTSQ